MENNVRYCTIGNALTASRLVLLPIIIAGIALNMGYVAVVAMGLALLSDLLDGRVSRYLKQASEFGAALDSTVDFIFLHLLFVAFYAAHVIHTYQFLVIYAAMLMTLAVEFMANLVSDRAEVVKTRFSKPVGAFEYLYLLFLVVRLVIPNTTNVMIVDLVIFAAIALCVVLHLWESCVCLKLLCKPVDK
ncbi:MAG: CDP-alcohol phosphatidyltransferase family protein [Armatimonadetes bacterium]|nr:CDP-alcohol phosphatidyltransferase family protein [Armatimonadota bacterium]